MRHVVPLLEPMPGKWRAVKVEFESAVESRSGRSSLVEAKGEETPLPILYPGEPDELAPKACPS